MRTFQQQEILLILPIEKKRPLFHAYFSLQTLTWACIAWVGFFSFFLFSFSSSMLSSYPYDNFFCFFFYSSLLFDVRKELIWEEFVAAHHIVLWWGHQEIRLCMHEGGFLHLEGGKLGCNSVFWKFVPLQFVKAAIAELGSLWELLKFRWLCPINLILHPSLHLLSLTLVSVLVWPLSIIKLWSKLRSKVWSIYGSDFQPPNSHGCSVGFWVSLGFQAPCGWPGLKTPYYQRNMDARSRSPWGFIGWSLNW